MIEYKAYACEIASRVNGRLSGDDCLIEAISIDTRENVERPFCYFAIRGENYDGHNFIEEAINNGAVLIIAEKKIDVDASVIYVENTVKALGYLAKNTKRMAKIIGITGSVGKTTTKDLIISVLKQKYNVTGTKYNYNNEIGVALTLLSIKNEEICVLEMGARGKGDIKWLTYISQPEIAIITNCGKSHIEYFGSEREIFNEKIEILNENCNAIVVPNEKRFKEYEFKNTYPIFVGANGDFYFDKVRLKKSGTSGYICSKGKMILKIESKTVSKRVFEKLRAQQQGNQPRKLLYAQMHCRPIGDC